jgi:hypothetical protein
MVIEALHLRQGIDLFDIDLSDVRIRWSAAGPVDHLCQGLCMTDDDCFDAAIATVAHPAGNAQLACSCTHVMAEAHALYEAGDDETTGFHPERPYLTFMPGMAPESGERI